MKKFTKGIFASFLVFAFVFAAAQTASAYTHMGMLKMGSTGSQVMELQKALNGNGFLISTTGAGSPGMESSHFGAKTKSAVMAFQSAKGLTPVDGIVGINTGAALGALTTTGGGVTYPAGCTAGSMFSTTTGQPCTATTTTVPGCAPGAMFSSTTGASCTGGSTPSTNGPLAGSFGDIFDVSEITSYNNEEVGEGQSDVKVAGFEIETTNDGDISVTSVKVQFDSTGNTGSTHLDDYVDSVSIWMGSTKVGSADAEDFSEASDIYTRTIALNNAVVRADDTEKFYISVDAVNTFDSADIATTNDSWDVDVLNIRFVDGSGVTTTDDATGDMPGMDVAIDFVSFGDSADTELKISKDSDSPEAGIVVVDDSTETDDVVLLTGKLKLSGDSDVTIDALPVTFTVSSGLLSDMASNLILVIDGEDFSESSATTSGGLASTVVFDNLDFDLAAGDTVDYEVRADINGTDDFAEGVSLIASITSDNRSNIDAENEERDQISDGDKIGSAIGEAQEFRSSGISVTLDSTDESVNADGTLGTYTVKFKVTAVGDDAYVGTATSKYTYAFQEASRGATTSGFSAAITNNGGSGNSTDTTTGGNWKINDGTSVTLTLQVFGNGASLSAGAYRAALTAIGWDSADTDAALANSYTSNMDDFHTDYEQLI